MNNIKNEKMLKSSKNSAKENIRSIASQSSIHALPNIINSHYLVMKIIWLGCFLLALGYNSYLVVQMGINYLNYDVLININYHTDFELNFPAIAICDYFPANRSREDMILSCTFNTEPCKMSYFGEMISTKRGRCHTFNAYKETVPILKALKPGNDLGLTLELFVGTPSKMPAAIPITGLVVAVYNATSRPLFAEEALTIQPHQMSSLMVTRHERKILPQPYSDCIVDVTNPNAFDSDEYRSTFSVTRVYRENICLTLCSTIPINPTNLTIDSPQLQIVRNVSDCVQGCPEECIQEEFIVGSYYSYYPNDQYATTYLRYKHPNLTNLSVAEIKDSVALLQVNYETMRSMVIEQTPAQTFPTLLGNLGGQLGLFLGMSFLSFVELFEIMFILSWECIFKKLFSRT